MKTGTIETSRGKFVGTMISFTMNMGNFTLKDMFLSISKQSHHLFLCAKK